MRKCSEALKNVCAGWGAPLSRRAPPGSLPVCRAGVCRAALAVGGPGARVPVSRACLGMRPGRPACLLAPLPSARTAQTGLVSVPRPRPAASLPPRLPQGPAPLSFRLVEPLVLPGPGFGLASLGFRVHPDGQAPGREPPAPAQPLATPLGW